MIPERVALALIARGWILRNKVIWAKPNGMPSSVTDRLATKWEYLFHLVRRPRYYYDLDAIRGEPSRDYTQEAAGTRIRNLGGRTDGLTVTSGTAMPNSAGTNPGDVWTIPTQPYPEAHFAVFPPELVRRPILATVPEQACRACGKGRERVAASRHALDLTRRQGREAQRRADGAGLTDDHIAAIRASGLADGTYAAANRDDAIEGLAAEAKIVLGAYWRESMHTAPTTGSWSDCGCGAGWQPGTVADPFFGSGTTGVMVRRLGRRCVGVELNEAYCALAADRFRQTVLEWETA